MLPNLFYKANITLITKSKTTHKENITGQYNEYNFYIY